MGEAGLGPDAYWEPSGPVGVDGRIEERIKRSRFIACLAPCRDEAGCRGFLNDIHAAHRDATHNCWAYLLGPHPTGATHRSGPAYPFLSRSLLGSCAQNIPIRTTAISRTGRLQ